MVTKKLEYDSSLGGSIDLGTHLPTYKYAASVINEIKHLVNSVKKPTSTKLIFQTLPKHMRRRAMSHNPKRLPRKYRQAHIAQMAKSGKPLQNKRPSRKYRRRPKNLLNAYIRRQRKNKWLETHIWHAKRFHMIQRWGYRLPYASCDKTFRACYRATTEHCLLQDISFYKCIELKGLIEDLKKGFRRLTSEKCGLSITAKTYLTGRREGYIDLFKDQQYPFHALGKIQFIWCPMVIEENLKENISRTLWLWIHPSSYQQILEELIKIFELKSTKISRIPLTEHDNEDNEDLNKIAGRNKKRLQFMTKITARQNIVTYKNDSTKIELKELKNLINRFRLTGPLSQRILSEAFKVKDLKINKNTKNQWMYNNVQDSRFSEAHNDQKAFWENCQNTINSTTDLLSNMVVALNIEDPRLNRPKKRMKTSLIPRRINNEEIYDTILAETSSQNLCYSVLWHQTVRDQISEEILSTEKYCSLREEQAIVPGEACAFEDTLQPVPILLIQRPGIQQFNYKRLSYGCGWDIIFPAGYGMIIWLSLIMWGARPGGLREFETLYREMGTEEHLPDTVAGKQMAGIKYEELRNKYFRLPPNKRLNYQKLCIKSPFRVPFEQLLRDWKESLEIQSNFFVLRDRVILQNLAQCLKKLNLQKFPKTLASSADAALIQLHFSMKNRGNFKDFSLICLPLKKDFKKYLKNLQQHENNPIFTEPLLKDLNEKERKTLRLEHKKLLKRLRRQRVREKRKKQETSTTKVFIRPAGTSLLCKEQFKKMSKLWLPEDYTALFTIRKQGLREVFGYITTANFSLNEGTVAGVGYVTLNGFKQLIDINRQCHIKQAMCLLRNTNSRHYRFATLKVNLDV